MKTRWVMTAVLVGAFAAGPVCATDLGDKAPALKIKEWVKGGPVDLKEGKGKTVYVVEFWATWCPPCRQTIPHLTELQKKYKDKDVVIIGISNEPADTVKPFVEKMGKDMEYVVAVDDDRATNEKYMQAFKIRGIPNAFIIDKAGLIVWCDHPMNEMDKAIDQILDGKYDLEKAKKARKVALKAQKIEEKLLPKYFEAVSRKSKSGLEKAAKLGEEILEKGKLSADLMNTFSWTILTDPRLKHRDIALALKAAQAAVDASESKNPMFLDTFARALWDNGNKEEAVKNQKKAVELCDVPDMKKEMSETLKKYENGEPPKASADRQEAKKGEKKEEKVAKKDGKKHDKKKSDEGDDEEEEEGEEGEEEADEESEDDDD